MASSSTLSYFLTLAPLLLIFITTSNAITNEQINQICSKAISLNTCLLVLRASPGVAPSDLKGVGHILLDLSTLMLTNTKSIIHSLVAKTTDPTLKKRYNACGVFFDEASSDIGDARDALNNSNDYVAMNIRVSAAQTSVGDCTDSLENSPVDPSDLKKRSQDVFETLSIALVVSNML